MTMAKVSGGHIRSWMVTIPPSVEEQEAVVKWLDERGAAIEKLQQMANAQVAKLREYRQALITAAVTGKIDLSDEAA